jgi:hypothetical protein
MFQPGGDVDVEAPNTAATDVVPPARTIVVDPALVGMTASTCPLESD